MNILESVMLGLRFDDKFQPVLVGNLVYDGHSIVLACQTIEIVTRQSLIYHRDNKKIYHRDNKKSD